MDESGTNGTSAKCFVNGEAVRKLQTHSIRQGKVRFNTKVKPLSCGFPTLEKNKIMVQNTGRIILIAGPAKVGKTFLACNIGLNLSVTRRTFMFSMEMDTPDVAKRNLCCIAQQPEQVVDNNLERNPEYYDDVQAKYRFDLCDEKMLAPEQLLSMFHDENRNEPIGCLIIDYVGLLDVGRDNRYLAFQEAVRRIKTEIALAYSIPVILLAQMEGGFNPGEDTNPHINHLADSKGIVRDVDTIMYLIPYGPTIPKNLKKVKVFHRHGSACDFEVEFNPETLEFIDKGEIV